MLKYITEEDYKFAKKHFKIKNIEHVNGVGLNIKRFEREIKNWGL